MFRRFFCWQNYKSFLDFYPFTARIWTLSPEIWRHGICKQSLGKINIKYAALYTNTVLSLLNSVLFLHTLFFDDFLSCKCVFGGASSISPRCRVAYRRPVTTLRMVLIALRACRLSEAVISPSVIHRSFPRPRQGRKPGRTMRHTTNP